MKRIGLLGGTFDPIHNGHIHIAEAAVRRAELDQVIFLPAGQPPHKRGRETAPAAARLDMVRLAIGGHPAFTLSNYEIATGRVNYTVDTLRYFRSQYASDRLFFIIGADSFRDMPLWKDYADILRLTSLIVVSRPDVPKETLLSRFRGEEPPPHILLSEEGHYDISSTEIRERVRRGQDIGGLVPDPVGAYIRTNHLYEE